MKTRTDAEIKAYVDGYNAAYNQFLECLKGKRIMEAVKNMQVFVATVNGIVGWEGEDDG